MLYRLDEMSGGAEIAPGPYTTYDFMDRADISAWALEAMEWAVKANLLTGTPDVTLMPRAAATRAQCAAVFMRYNEIVKSST
jgi:hypothetical protein